MLLLISDRLLCFIPRLGHRTSSCRQVTRSRSVAIPPPTTRAITPPIPRRCSSSAVIWGVLHKVRRDGNKPRYHAPRRTRIARSREARELAPRDTARGWYAAAQRGIRAPSVAPRPRVSLSADNTNKNHRLGRFHGITRRHGFTSGA